MGKVRILEIKESVFADNDRQADQLRSRLKEKGVFLMNLMSSPGSGKTTTLKRTIAALKDDLRIGVMEADIDSDVDALAIAETGAKAIQLHTGGMCQVAVRIFIVWNDTAWNAGDRQLCIFLPDRRWGYQCCNKRRSRTTGRTGEIPWNRNTFPVKTRCLEKSCGIGAETGNGERRAIYVYPFHRWLCQ